MLGLVREAAHKGAAVNPNDNRGNSNNDAGHHDESNLPALQCTRIAAVRSGQSEEEEELYID